MTREEAAKCADNMTYRDAINNLMKAKSIPYRKATFIKTNELLKALDQGPCNDAISRQAVLDAIEDDNRNGHYSCFASNNDAQCFKDVICSLPSINPQEPVLDKIRAEIDGLLNDEDNHMYAHGVMDCLEIIDNYKTESEDKE